jgi:hypothetical protein
MPPIKSGFAPRCRILTPTESQSSFETWKETLLFNLTLDGTFEFLLEDGFKWKSISIDNRGLQAGTGEDKMTAKQKAAILSLLLGTIAGYASVISRQYITQEALSLSDIWHRLRIFYGFRKSGALILDLSTVHLEEGESYEALWERFHAFTMDNLLSPADGLRHLNENKPKREEMTPTLLNTTVVLWLRAIHPSLPALVKQRYSTELRSKTVATLREDISESLDALLAELSGESAANIARAAVYNSYQRRSSEQSTYRQKATRLCPLCEANNRPNDHFLSECSYLPEGDRRFMASRAKTRAVEVDDYKDPNVRQITCTTVASNERKVPATTVNPVVRKVTVKSSPYLFVQYMNHSVKLTVDSGAEANMMKLSYAKYIGATIHKAATGATQADGISNMDIEGEVHLVFKLEDVDLYFDALVSKNLSVDVLAGVPFMDTNDVYAKPSKQVVCVGEREFKCNITNKATKAEIVRIQRQTVLLPDDTFSLPDPPLYAEEEVIEPCIDFTSFSNVKYQDCWLQPRLISPCINTLTPLMRPVTMYPETPTIYTEMQAPSVKPKVSLDYPNIGLDPDGLLIKRQLQQFGDQSTVGGLTKLADYIDCGGSSSEEVMKVWERVPQSLKDNGFRLSASKTTIRPKSVSTLGPHRISTLATVDPPYADLASRNAVECDDKRRQVCTFINNSMESGIRLRTVKEVLDSEVTARSGHTCVSLSDMPNICLQQSTTTSTTGSDVESEDFDRVDYQEATEDKSDTEDSECEEEDAAQSQEKGEDTDGVYEDQVYGESQELTVRPPKNLADYMLCKGNK